MTTHENHTLCAKEQSDYIRTHARHDFVHGDRIEVMTEEASDLLNLTLTPSERAELANSLIDV